MLCPLRRPKSEGATTGEWPRGSCPAPPSSSRDSSEPGRGLRGGGGCRPVLCNSYLPRESALTRGPQEFPDYTAGPVSKGRVLGGVS